VSARSPAEARMRAIERRGTRARIFRRCERALYSRRGSRFIVPLAPHQPNNLGSLSCVEPSSRGCGNLVAPSGCFTRRIRSSYFTSRDKIILDEARAHEAEDGISMKRSFTELSLFIDHLRFCALANRFSIHRANTATGTSCRGYLNGYGT